MSSSQQFLQPAKRHQSPPKRKAPDARFLALAQESTDVFWVLSPEGSIQEVCPGWQTFTGQKPREYLGQGWQDAFHPADRPRVAETLLQSITTSRSADVDCTLRRRDSTYRLIHLRVIPVSTADGQVREMVVCGKDITNQRQAEQMSKAQMQLAMTAARVGMWDWDLLTNQLIWTDQCKALFGWPADREVSHERFLVALHPDDQERADRITKQSLTEQTAFFTEYRVIWPDGSIHWLADRGRGIYNAQGKPIHMIGAVMDVTERKQAEEALRENEVRFRRFMNSNIIGMTITDLEGNIHEANDAFLSLVGYTREDLETGHLQWTTMTPPESQAAEASAMEEILATGHFQPFEKEYLTKDGQRVPVVIGGTIFRQEGSLHFVMSFILDQTARKEVEKQKDLFLGITSHELKTPLAALRGTLQLAQRRTKRFSTGGDPLPSKVKTFLEELTCNLTTSVRQVDVQTRLINDLLDVSRITANTLKLSLRRCDLGSIVRETVEDLRMTAPDRLLFLDVPEHSAVDVLVDRDRISQVVTNYVTNALRYSHPDQPVHLGLTIQENVVRVWVRDKGPGLSEEAKRHIWQRFSQIKGVPVLSGSGKGLGLGLYICQMLIAQHQGEVGVESTAGEGSTFWFTLPLAK